MAEADGDGGNSGGDSGGDSGDDLETDGEAAPELLPPAWGCAIVPVDHSVDYKVGYKNPPLHTRFKPGQSGNPAGRPKGRQSLARDLYEELQETIATSDDAGDYAGDESSDDSLDDMGAPARGRISKQRAILRALTGKAMAGDARAAAMVFYLIERLIGAGPPGEGWAREGSAPGHRGRSPWEPWEDAQHAGESARERLARRLDELARRLGTDDEEGEEEADAPDGGSPAGPGM